MRALIDVILKDGAHAFTMQNVADRAGVGLRTVYRHFESRELLLEGLSGYVEQAAAGLGFAPPVDFEGLRAVVPPLYHALEAMRDAARASVIASVASAAPTRELAAIARFAASRPAAKALLQARDTEPGTLARLEREDPEVAARLHAYLRFWGLRTFGSDAGRPSIAEQPDLVMGLVADLMTGDGRMAEVARGALVAEARAALPDPRPERGPPLAARSGVGLDPVAG